MACKSSVWFGLAVPPFFKLNMGFVVSGEYLGGSYTREVV